MNYLEDYSKGLNSLWAKTTGDAQICIAILDGPIRLSHPSLENADITQFHSPTSKCEEGGGAEAHGTQIASIIFGQHNEGIQGVSPNCRGISIPIYEDDASCKITRCSQSCLATAILHAVQDGAHIINISGGQLSASGRIHPFLDDAIEYARKHNCLIVAATGNDGCDCLHLPGAHPSVLAVGSVDVMGVPLGFSNWGEDYRHNGVLAPGEHIPVASLDGGVGEGTGTSYTTAAVSGIVALLLSIRLQNGLDIDPLSVREDILATATKCKDPSEDTCRRLLGGVLDINALLTQYMRTEEGTMDSSTEIRTTQNTMDSSITGAEVVSQDGALAPSGVSAESSVSIEPSACSCQKRAEEQEPELEESIEASSVDVASATTIAPSGCSGNPGPPKLVYALGTLDYDLGPLEARKDSIISHMPPKANNANSAKDMIAYLSANPQESTSIIWTLNVDDVPIYAIQPVGAYAESAYATLLEFLTDQSKGEADRMSVPGEIIVKTTLFSGQTVEVIAPTLRGMYSWETKLFVKRILGKESSNPNAQTDLMNFLNLVYYKLRNLGSTPEDRALNFAATNALKAQSALEDAAQKGFFLDSIDVEPSPLCRPDSDCWDVVLTFFNPDNTHTARNMSRFTVDVSDVVPVQVGTMRSWSMR